MQKNKDTSGLPTAGVPVTEISRHSVLVNRVPYGRAIDCVIAGVSGNANYPTAHYYAESCNWVEVPEGTRIPDYTFSLGELDAQGLMDDLYRLGIRPSEAESPGELAATKRHLDDFRKLVGKHTGVELR